MHCQLPPQKLTVVEAAAIMDVDPQFLRIALQQGRFSEFGVAVKMKRWSYYINAERFYDYLAGLGVNSQEHKEQGQEAAAAAR